MRINRLGGEDQFDRMLREGRHVQQAAPMGRTSIHNGRTRFVGMESIIIEGSGRVTGTWIIDGALEGEGSLGWTGLAAFDGPVEITDTLDVLASTKLRGLVELLNDLSIATGGKILVGTTMRIVPSTDGGAVEFVDGSRLSNSGGTTGIRAGSSRMEISDAFARMSISGRGFTINSTGYQMTSLPTTPLASVPGAFVGAVIADAAGNLRRVV